MLLSIQQSWDQWAAVHQYKEMSKCLSAGLNENERREALALDATADCLSAIPAQALRKSLDDFSARTRER